MALLLAVIVATLAFLIIFNAWRIRCFLSNHNMEVTFAGPIHMINVDKLSIEGIQRATQKCKTCGKEEEVFRNGSLGFGGPVSMAKAGKWLQLGETSAIALQKKHYIDSLPLAPPVIGERLLSCVQEGVTGVKFATDFLKFSDIYLSFKSQLVEAARTGINKDIIAGNAKKQAINFRQAYYDQITSNIKSSLHAFRIKFIERMIGVIARQNPYSAIQADKLTVFPQGCKFWFLGDSSAVVVVEEQPQMRTIRTNNESGHYARPSYRLAFPYIQFILVFHYIGRDADRKEIWHMQELRVSCRPKPLLTINDMLCELPLSDLKEFVVCMGQKWVNPKGSIAEQVTAIVDYFWHSMFKREWTFNIDNAIAAGLGLWPLDKWEKLDVLSAMEKKWIEKNSLLSELAKIAAATPNLLNPTGQDKLVQDAVAECWETINDSLLPLFPKLEQAFVECTVPAVTSLCDDAVTLATQKMDQNLEKRG